MIGRIIFLAALALVTSRPADDDVTLTRDNLREPSDLCPPIHNSFLIAHEWDCNKFYYCEYGMKYIAPRSCPANTVFSPQIQVCVHTWAYNCQLPGYPPTVNPTLAPTEPTTTTTQAPATTTTQAPTTTTTQAPTTTSTQAPTTTPTPAPTQVPTQSTQTPSEILPSGCPADSSIHHLLPHAECNKYYQCVFGQPVERQCVAGTYFSYRIQGCDWPHNVECAGSPTQAPTTAPTQAPTTAPTQAPTTTPTPAPTQVPTQTTQAPSVILPSGCPADSSIHHLLPHAECNKYYQCVFGQPVERQCVAGTYFSYRIQGCDWPHNVECAGSPTQAPTTAPTQAPTTAPTQAPTTTPTPAPTQVPTQTTQTPSEILPNGCPADSSIHHLLPHAECNKYYQCVFGQPVERQCVAGTYFNYRIQGCDWPANVECAGNPTQAPTTTPTQAPTQVPTQTTQGPSEILPNGCPADSSIHHLLPHAECNKYYQCVFGQPVERQCVAGTYFNYKIQGCDWPANVECAGNPTQAPTTTPTPAPTQVPTQTTQTPSEILPNGCPADSSIHHLLPHAECNKYYQCVFGQPVERQCVAGTYFNYKIQACDWPANVECAGNPTQAPTTTPTPAPTQVPTQTTQGPSEILPNGCPADYSIHHLLPHAECNKFYQCNFGQLVEKLCAPGTYFNYRIQVCDWPANVQCAGSIPTETPTETPSTVTLWTPTVPSTETPTPPPTETPTETPSTVTLWTPTVPSTETPTPPPTETPTETPSTVTLWTPTVPSTETTTPPTETPTPPTDTPTTAPLMDRCQNCNVVPWAHDTDCDKFWRCDGEKTVLSVCSEGLHFNPSTQNCDFICNAGCVRQEVQATVSAAGIKLYLPWDRVDSDMEKLIELSTHQNSDELFRKILS